MAVPVHKIPFPSLQKRQIPAPILPLHDPLKDHLLTWDQALSYCNGLGVALVKISGAEENDFVLDLSKKKTTVDKVWIGLKWYTGDDYYWYDTSVPGYTNCAPGQPNGAANEPCGSMYTEEKRKSSFNRSWLLE